MHVWSLIINVPRIIIMHNNEQSEQYMSGCVRVLVKRVDNAACSLHVGLCVCGAVNSMSRCVKLRQSCKLLHVIIVWIRTN
jgi:hypothetical protein